MPILTILDARKIQEFIFASNRLADIANGSDAIAQELGREALQPEIARQGGKLLLAAGGNIWASFESEQQSRAFAGAVSRRLMNELPGLDLAGHHEFYDNGGLGGAIPRALRAAASRKLGGRLAAPLLGLGTTARCAETGLPAVQLARNKRGELRPRSALLGTRDARPGDEAVAKSALPASLTGHPSAQDFRFPRETERLGATHGDTSMVAVVYLDGNGVGKKLQAWCAEQHGPDNRVGDALGALSAGIAGRAERAWSAVLARVLMGLRLEKSKGQAAWQLCATGTNRSFKLNSHEGSVFLPVRQLYRGGDDSAFICDGRIGLGLAVVALRAFGEGDDLPLGGLSASAGVAIVGNRFPLFRALEIARNECRAAKGLKPSGAAALSWQIGERRPERTARPYRLDPDWHELADGLLGTGAAGLNGPNWASSRNKAKELADHLAFPERLDAELSAFRIRNPGLDLPRPLDAGRLADALELLDLHWTIDEVAQ